MMLDVQESKTVSTGSKDIFLALRLQSNKTVWETVVRDCLFSTNTMKSLYLLTM